MSGEVESVGVWLKTPVCILGVWLKTPNKNVGYGFGLEFVGCVGLGQGITNAPKHF